MNKKAYLNKKHVFKKCIYFEYEKVGIFIQIRCFLLNKELFNQLYFLFRLFIKYRFLSLAGLFLFIQDFY